LIELMVGLTIGLFIVAGTLTMFANQVGSSRQLLQQARLHQEMRSVMDLVTRDLRRAGAWDNAILGTVAIGSTRTTVPNPYQAASASTDGRGFNVIDYWFTRDRASRGSENNALDSNELFGFKQDGDILRMQLGAGNWQPLTDPKVITVRNFFISSPNTPTVSAASACVGGCTGPTCPQLSIRQYTLTLQAALASDSNVTRTLSTTVRLRNDQIQGACP
jgi:type IV pilus assembly protein PilW